MLTKGNIKYTYNAGNQLVSDGVDTYAYDKNGNLTQKGDTKYTYNARNLLESYVSEEYSESYTYNAFGLLSSVKTPESTTSFAWDVLNGDGQMLSSTVNGITTDYTYGIERISAQTKGQRTEYVYDARGSVIAEVNSRFLGNDITEKSYSPFGEPLNDNSTGFGYNGEYYNAATGMIYLRARFYAPEMNRFSQKDILRGSVTDALSLNRYLYCQNDPVNFIDPSGMTLKSFLKSAVNLASAVRNTATAIKTTVQNTVKSVVKTAVTTAVNTVATTVKTAYQSIVGGNTIKQVASDAYNAATSVVNQGYNSAAQIVTDAASQIIDIAKQGFGEIIDTGLKYLSQLVMPVVNGAILIEDLIPWKISDELNDENYETNLQNDITDEIINDQFYGDKTGVNNFVLGSVTMQNTGCEVIATYNAMLNMGYDPSLAKLTQLFEALGAVTASPHVDGPFGPWGSNPFSIADVLKCEEMGVEFRKINSVSKITSDGETDSEYILSYWVDGRIDKGIHTIAIKAKVDGTYAAFNDDQINRSEITYSSIDELKKAYGDYFVTGYKLEG